MLGHAARGGAGEPPLDRRTGVGRVSAKKGDYADALSKGHGVHLLAMEGSGAMNSTLVALLRALAKGIGLPDVQDTTVYGTARGSTTSFFEHHISAISAAIVHADADIVINHAAVENLQLTLRLDSPPAAAAQYM